MKVCRLVLLAVLALPAGAAAQRQLLFVGVPLTLKTPEPEEFELALDEVELDWSESGSGPAAPPNVVAFTAIVEQTRTTAVFKISGASTIEALALIARQLETANAPARADFVLYEPRRGRDPSTRRALSNTVALLLADPADPDRVVAEYASRDPQTLQGVPGAYVLNAGDPLSAIQLADTLSSRAGVKAAYPLLKRRQYIR